jgi:uncharacterized SAM-binding protein YcdF (DUF218 family)
MHQTLEPAECIIVCGSRDLKVAEWGAELFLRGFADHIVFSGGLGRFTTGVFTKPEAETFADVALKMGVPEDRIWLEDKSTNTGENIAFTKSFLVQKRPEFKSFIVVHKPYMERRTYATFTKIWPDAKCIVTSPPFSFSDYIAQADRPKDEIISIIVGDTQRLKIYADKGFLVPQDIPVEVWLALEKLIELGYSQYLVAA